MHRFGAPLTCSALLRFLLPAAHLLGVISCILLICSCTSNSSADASTATASTLTSTTGTPSASTDAPAPSTGSPTPSTEQVSLTWDAVSVPNLMGYRLYYGQTSQTYTAHIDVGAQTTYTV